MDKKFYEMPEMEVVELNLSGDVLLVVSGDEDNEVTLGGEGGQDDFPRQ